MYLKRFPFGPSEVPRWKRDQYPNVTYEEYDYLKNAVNGMDKSTYQLFTKREIVKYDTKSVSDVNIVPATYEFVEIQPQKIKEGRFLMNRSPIQERQLP